MPVDGETVLDRLLNPEEAKNLILEVHADDVRRARHLLGGAVQAAGDQWIPVDAVIEALIGTATDVGLGCVAPQRLSRLFEEAAATLRQSGCGRLNS